MGKIRYSAGLKGVMILLQEIFSVVLVVCIILVTTLLDRNMLEFNDLRNNNFLESGYYEGLFEAETQKIFRYIEYKKQFETDGEYNPEKAVNIMAYGAINDEVVETFPPMMEGDMFRYYLADLEEWSRGYKKRTSHLETTLYVEENGILFQSQKVYLDSEPVHDVINQINGIKDLDISLQKTIVDAVQNQYGAYYQWENYNMGHHNPQESNVFSEVVIETEETDLDEFEMGMDVQLEDVIHKVLQGQLFELQGEELKLILEDLCLVGETIITDGYILEEDYYTVEGLSIWDEFLSGNISVGEMQRTYQCLAYTLDNIGVEITEYKRMVNRYENGNSNVTFFVYSERDGEIYSNIGKITGEESFVSFGEKLGSYFYYSKNDIRMNTTVDTMEEFFYNVIEPMESGNYTEIFLGVDSTFSHNDYLKEAKEEYGRLQPWAVSSVVAAGISLLGWFLCFIYLSLVAGRCPEDGEIHVNWFDKIKTEILILAVGIYGVLNLIILDEFAAIFDRSDIIGMMILSGGIIFVEIAVFMIFYLSFVRRMKAGIMWSGSILCWIGRGIQKVIRNWKPSLKILVAFGIHVIITLILLVWTLATAYRGSAIIGIFLYLLLCAGEAVIFLRQGIQTSQIISGIKRIADEDLEYKIDTQQLTGDNKVIGETINNIGEGLHRAVDDSMKNERLKTDLITNVSHDIKTPLTSIINYVDLLKREKLDNQKANDYIKILDAKSQRLKQLTEDLVEASKISSGNISLQMERINLVELVHQTAGEFNEKFENRGLTAILKLPKEPVIIMADGRRIWRVIENLYNNVAKYAMENTRVYVDMDVEEMMVSFSIKNISQQALNIDASELTERFIRGDVSRSTEGSGLGLSIAQNLTQLMGGTFQIYLDGDLFKATVTFPVVPEKE